MQMLAGDKSMLNPCNVTDCLLVERGALLACTAVTDRITQQRFSADYIIDFDAFESDRIVIIGTGAVSLEWTLGDGRRQVFGFMFRGDILTPSDIGSGVRVMALTDGILYFVDADVIERCRGRREESRYWRAALIAARLAEATAHTLMLGQMTAQERIVAFLMRLSERIGRATGGEIHIGLPMSRDHIADHLGLKPETVSRQLNDLRRRGLIRLPKPCQVEIADGAGLRALSPLA